MGSSTSALPSPLWQPHHDAWTSTRLGQFARYAGERGGRRFANYDELWAWSVDELGEFWATLWAFFGVGAPISPDAVLTDAGMPGATWFRGVAVNYAEQALRGAHSADPDRPVVIAHSQTREPVTLTAADLEEQVARTRAGLQRLGVGPGDRVAAYLPNIPETLVAFLATASLGAIWSSCAPEFGPRSVIDRFCQISPKVLLTVDGYRYGDKRVDRSAEISEIRSSLPSLEATVLVPYLRDNPDPAPGSVSWEELSAVWKSFSVNAVPFDHPLYILFSSGTTGLPKPIVHGHGGIVVEHLKALALQTDLGPTDRFFWFTTTGWTMWNYLISGLMVGSAVVMFDGNPAYPDLMTLWRLAEVTQTTYFGASAPWIMSCRKAGLRPGRLDLSALRGVGSTGAPLPAEGFEWVYAEIAPAANGGEVVLSSICGGTDVCTAFVGGSPLVPVYAGEIACRWLGTKVEAYNSAGQSLIGERGELVVTAPMPSMPVGFWGDPRGSRFHAAYFDVYPGVWRHGDWITITDRGTCVVTGRSDATLNRGGVRLGTAEFYSVVEDLEAVRDSLVVHLEDPDGGMGELILFVALAPDQALGDDLRAAIRSALLSRLSPRHLPDTIYAVPAIPRTLTGKKLEIPVKRILTGTPVAETASRGSLADPDALAVFEEMARAREATRPADVR